MKTSRKGYLSWENIRGEQQMDNSWGMTLVSAMKLYACPGDCLLFLPQSFQVHLHWLSCSGMP